ncbi:MAG: CPBP family intramembrane metalloprotease [Deltaproteobacteria bacterium]|nr:CPBP family intramembrane metalloprotease [Deltaproteobacteria bacterium]
MKKRTLLIALCSWFFMLIFSFLASIYMEWGPAESEHAPASVWMYVRRGLLLTCALVLPRITGGAAATYGWKISFKWLLIAVPLGIAMGFGNKGGFDPRLVSALLLACLHALATELFFRAYLITALSGVFRTFWPPVIISSLMYGIYYLTVWTAWSQPGALKLVFVGLFTFIGLIHAYCYKKSNSFLVPWLIHFLGVLKYRVLL